MREPSEVIGVNATLLALRGVRVQFPKLLAVNNVSFELHPGDLLGLVGPNGAGKTTLLRAIVGLQPTSAGTVELMGESIAAADPSTMRNIGFTPDTPPIYENLTVGEFLTFIAKGYGLSASQTVETIDFWLQKVWLSEKRDQKLKALSRGMRQRVGIARTLLSNPNVILLDEPAGGLDPAGRVQFRELLVNLRDQGKALIVSSHILSDMDEYCTHIGIMSAGRMVQFGTVGALIGHEDTRARYTLTLARAHPGLAELLAEYAGVASVSVDTTRANFEFDRDTEAAADLLATLVARRVPVAAFAPDVRGLEEAYLRFGIQQVGLMAILGTNNAIAWSQFRILGGWKRTGIAAVLLLFILIGLILFSITVSYSTNQTLEAWSLGLLMAQMGMLLLFGSGISSAINNDIRSRMLESHRLMPVSSAEAIAGYMIGPTLQAIFLWAIIAIVGGLCGIASSRLNATSMFASSLIVLSFSIYMWTIFILGAFLSRAFFILILIGTCIMALPSGAAISAALPSLSLLNSPMAGQTIFRPSLGMDDLIYPYGVCLLAQACFGLIFLTAAARRYRHGDAPVMGPMLNLLLLFAFLACAMVAMYHRDQFGPPGYLRVDEVAVPQQLVSTLGAGMVLAATAIASAGYATMHWRRAQAQGSSDRRIRKFNIFAMAILCAAILFGFHFLIATRNPQVEQVSTGYGRYLRYEPIHNLRLTTQATERVALVLLLFVWSINAVVRLALRFGKGPALFVTIWIMATWIAPVIIEAATAQQLGRNMPDPTPTWQLASPIGMLAYLVASDNQPVIGDTNFGFIVQGSLVAWLEIMLLLMLRRRSNDATSPPPIPQMQTA